jgi:hypothetical protein
MRTKHENRRNPRNEGCNNATTRSSSLSSQLGYRDMSQRQSSCHRLIAVSSFHDNTLVIGFAQHGAVASPIFYPPAAGKNPYTSLLFAGTLKALNPFIARAMSDMNATNVVANRIPMEGAKEGSDNLEDQKPSVTEMMKILLASSQRKCRNHTLKYPNCAYHWWSTRKTCGSITTIIMERSNGSKTACSRIGTT